MPNTWSSDKILIFFARNRMQAQTDITATGKKVNFSESKNVMHTILLKAFQYMNKTAL